MKLPPNIPKGSTLFMRLDHKNPYNTATARRDYYMSPTGVLYVLYVGDNSATESSLNRYGNHEYILELSIRWAANPDQPLVITDAEWNRCEKA